MQTPYRSIKYALILFFAFIFISNSLTIPTAESGIFKWKDDQGKVHYTDSTSKIPRKYRSLKTGKLKTIDEDLRKNTQPVSLKFDSPIKDEIVIPLKPIASGNFVVDVLINGQHNAELIVDTGASMTILSEELIKSMHLSLGQNATMPFSTAGGVIWSPLMVLNQVKVGDAIVSHVEAASNQHMQGMDGLLGMSFLGEFKVEIDRSTNQMTLRALHKPGDILWGGHNASWWKDKFKDYSKNFSNYQALAKQESTNVDKAQKYRKLADHYKKLFDTMTKKANAAGLPKEHRARLRNQAAS